jgi:hypothetical protein
MLLEFWQALPPGEYVHPEDRKVLDRYPGVFNLNVAPGPMNGRLLTAPVVACYLNPRCNNEDLPCYADPVHGPSLFEQMKGKSDYPIWAEPWKKWFVEHVGFGNKTAEQLASEVAILNACAYASKDSSRLDSIVPQLSSSWRAKRYLHEVLIPQAKRGERFIVVVWGNWHWGIETKSESDTIRVDHSRGGKFSQQTKEAIAKWLDARS